MIASRVLVVPGRRPLRGGVSCTDFFVMALAPPAQALTKSRDDLRAVSSAGEGDALRHTRLRILQPCDAAKRDPAAGFHSAVGAGKLMEPFWIGRMRRPFGRAGCDRRCPLTALIVSSQYLHQSKISLLTGEKSLLRKMSA